MGVNSALSLPLSMPGQLVGGINVYAYDKDVFDDHAVELGELLHCWPLSRFTTRGSWPKPSP